MFELRAKNKKTTALIRNLLNDRRGNFGILAALTMPVLLVVAGGTIDVASAFLQKQHLQEKLDSAVLAAAPKPDISSQRLEVESFFGPDDTDEASTIDLVTALSVVGNSDGSLTGTFSEPFHTTFLGLVGLREMPITVKSTAIADKGTEAGACIYVMGNQNQAVLINSGATIKATKCGIDVQSTSNPAFIMNSRSTVDTSRFCVKGTKYIKNGGELTNLEVGCAAGDDPYAGKLPEPTVSSVCTTSGTRDGQTQVIKPGVHCGTTFNGSPTITFEPGLHIIKGRMIINSNSKVTAEGVTFYFPDVYSEIRANGGLSFTATAPTSGIYKGILMFEKTSDASNNANKQQYIFNGSVGEKLEGIVHLPNRDVVYNSTTNQVNKISMVVNTMLVNSANWLLEPYDGTGSSSGKIAAIRLVK
jgi:Flp pilus assembly protein TadG